MFTAYEIFKAIKSRHYKYGLILILSTALAGFFAWTNLYNHHDRSMAMANYSLGNIFFKKGDYQSAKHQYQEALEQASCVPNAHLNIGVIAFYNSDTAAARAEFQNEIDNCGPSAKAFNNLSLLARLKGDDNRAYDFADSAVIYFPYFKEAYINRILAAFAGDDTLLIKTAINSFVNAFPRNIAGRYYRGWRLFQSGRLDSAQKDFSFVVSSKAKDVVAEYDLSEIYSAALPYGYNPEKIRGRAFYQLGLIYVQKNAVDSALYNFRQAVSLMPDNPDAHLNLALAYDQKGEYQLAEIQFKEAIAIDSVKAPYYYNYALLLGKTGNYPAAMEMLKKAVTIDPEFARAENLLKALQEHLNR